MAFIRRLYYLKASGEVLTSYQMQGNLGRHDRDWDYKTNTALQPYAKKRHKVGVFEWAEPDPEIEQAFTVAYGVSVDVRVKPYKLVFDYTPPEPLSEPPSDADELLDIIKGVTE